jgi:Cd2+/Zn2+-exporting ATPase
MGNHRLIEEKGLCRPDVHRLLLEYEKQGYTVTVLASGREVLAVFAVADTIKATSREALAVLKRKGIVTVMLTGDNETTAKTIADETGIENVRGNLLPAEKLDAVRELQKQYGKTAMIGDGINDAPALAHADTGIAMGDAGTDIAMEAADVVIMNDDLRRIPQMIDLSTNTYSILWQNILIALGIKLVFFALALFGSATMWMAVFADTGASLLVLLNGLRVLRK